MKIPLPSFSDMLVDEARGRLYITGGTGTGTIVITDLDGSSLRPGQYTWAHTLVEGGLAWGPGNRFYAVTEQLSEPDIVTLRIRDVT